MTALVGGDERVRAAHRHAVDARAARHGTVRAGPHWRESSSRDHRANGSPPSLSTTAPGRSRWYSAPQLHTHTVVFNLTTMADGRPRALQPRELYRTQQYATAVYRFGARRRTHGARAMRSSEGPVDSPRFGAIRPTISRRPVRGANKSKARLEQEGTAGRRRRADRRTQDA